MGGKQSGTAVFFGIQLKSKYLLSGDLVEGTVYFALKEPRNFTSLTLNVECKEKSRWIRMYGRGVLLVFGNALTPYQSGYELKRFGQVVDPGQYSFSFSFLLPSSLPGTLQLNSSNYIAYTLTAQLIQDTQQSYKASIPLIIQQPQRNRQILINQTEIIVKCCSCCCLFTKIQLKMQISKSSLRNGDTINCSIQVNNSQGNSAITAIVIVLNEYIKQISDWDYQNQFVNHSYQLQRCQVFINPGSSQLIDTVLTIPQSVSFCSSIGQTIERYYLIEAIIDFGFCSNNASVSIPVIMNSSLMENRKPEIQSNIDPILLDRDAYYNQKTPMGLLSPYVYSPKKWIVYPNQGEEYKLPIGNQELGWRSKMDLIGYMSNSIALSVKRRMNKGYNLKIYDSKNTREILLANQQP